MIRARFVIPGLLAALVGAYLIGQRPVEAQPPAPEKNGEKTTDKVGEKQTDRKKPTDKKGDPTRPSEGLKDALTPPGRIVPKVPSGPAGVTVLGKVITQGRKPIVLLEIGGKKYTVSADMALTIGGIDYRIVRIDRKEIRLEIGEKKNILTLP